MLSLIALLFVISSGSLFCAAFFDKKYEEILPITISSIIFVLLLFGVMDLLSVGVVVVSTVAFLLYISSFFGIVVKKHQKGIIGRTISNFFTPGNIVFTLTMVMCSFFIKGKLFDLFDELSHWGDVVKAMLMTDKLSTSSETRCMFQSYPPAMALFQYYFQKLGMIFNEFHEISEWRCVLAYNIVVLSFPMPLFKSFRWKDFWKVVIFMIIIILAPLVFYLNAYTSIMIDYSLAALTGAGLAALFLHKSDDSLFIPYMASLCATLTMLKDAGLLFSIILSVFTMAIYWMDKKKEMKKVAISFFTLCGSIIIPKVMWKISQIINNTPKSFPVKIGLNELLSVFSSDGYRKTVFIKYFKRLFTDGVSIGDSGITITYFVLIIGFVLLAIWLMSYNSKEVSFNKNRIIYAGICVLVIMVIHIVGLVVSYMFMFGEQEAVELASYTRYIRIPFCAIWLFLVYSMLFASISISTPKYLFGILLLIVFVSPMEYVCSYLAKTTVKYSISEREQYDELISKIQSSCSNDEKIWFISEGDDGFDYCNIRYSIRPIETNRFGTFSIHIGDGIGMEATPRDWMNSMIEDGYNCVAIYAIDDQFVENYRTLFEKPETIKDNSLFYIDKEKEKLILMN